MATVRLVDNGTAIVFRVIVCDIANVTMAHIHVGAAGDTGPPIIPFIHGILFSSPHGCKVLTEGTRSATDLNTKVSSKITNWNDFVTALLTGNTYINVHTTANTNGEIRGQLVHEHESENENDQGDD